MAIRSRLIADSVPYPSSHFRICQGNACDAIHEIYDSVTKELVDWSGHQPRFRIYHQLAERRIALEITDPQKCWFSPNGIWRLRMSERETASLPLGGLTFTLEHQAPGGEFQLGVQGGVSCWNTPALTLHRDLPQEEQQATPDSGPRFWNQWLHQVGHRRHAQPNPPRRKKADTKPSGQ